MAYFSYEFQIYEFQISQTSQSYFGQEPYTDVW